MKEFLLEETIYLMKIQEKRPNIRSSDFLICFDNQDEKGPNCFYLSFPAFGSQEVDRGKG